MESRARRTDIEEFPKVVELDKDESFEEVRNRRQGKMVQSSSSNLNPLDNDMRYDSINSQSDAAM